jgi:hypothetical protein
MAGGSNPSAGLSAGSQLCMSCGLCCMGVIHDRAALDESEIPAARRLGLQVMDGERPLFALPCPRLEGTQCGVYSQRPSVCQRYKCQLLQDVEAGRIEPRDAVHHVGIAKGLLERLRGAMPAGMSIPRARATARRPADADAPGDRPPPELRLRATALELYLDRHFRNARDRRALVLEPTDSESKEQ